MQKIFRFSLTPYKQSDLVMISEMFTACGSHSISIDRTFVPVGLLFIHYFFFLLFLVLSYNFMQAIFNDLSFSPVGVAHVY